MGLHPLDPVPDNVGGIPVDVDIPLLGLRVEAEQVAAHSSLGVLRHPNHAVRGDQHLVDVALGMGRHPLLPLSRARIELDQPTRDPPVTPVYVALRVKPHILYPPPPGSCSRGILRRVHALPRRIFGYVVFHEHRLAELRFVKRRFLDGPDIARRRAGTEVLDHVCH